MELMTRANSSSYEIVITGNIKTIIDGQSIKEAVAKAYQAQVGTPINLYIKDSFIITSSVIGFLIKATNVDKIPLHVIVGSQELYDMLSEMNLLDSMNVRKA
ncbi:MAG: hypothetical protein PHN18_05660 [Sulfurospirillaceae bacterium]|nr:hypothetical protein [Sulfurospirillaceae bacterium]MDD2825797.1 hypothetical protein [Sulfurospirillaceae bacterium]